MTASFGLTLRRLRESRGITQKALATRLGVCAQYVSAVETGSKPFLSAARVARVGSILKLTECEIGELQTSQFDGARKLAVGGRCSTRQFEFAAFVAQCAHRLREGKIADLESRIRKSLVTSSR